MKLNNSPSEIGLFISYGLAIWLVPLAWLDSAFGTIVFAIVSIINPYLSISSISFSENPNYFIHCQVLATLFFIPWGFFLIVKRNGGALKWQQILADHIKKKGDSLFVYWLKFSIFILPLIYAMLWLVDYPLTSAEYLLWVSQIGIPISACMIAYVMSLYLGISHTVWKLFLNN